MCSCLCWCVITHGGQRSTLGVVPQWPPLLLFEAASHWDPGLANEARLATQGRLQIHQSPQCWDYRNTDHQGFLRWVLGIKLRSLGLLGKYGTDWVPSDLFIFLCVVWDLTTAHWMTQSSLCRPGWT